MTMRRKHGLWHWLLHRLHWQPCRNDCVYLDGAFHHWVYCVVCGRIAFSFTTPGLEDRDEVGVVDARSAR